MRVTLKPGGVAVLLLLAAAVALFVGSLGRSSSSAPTRGVPRLSAGSNH